MDKWHIRFLELSDFISQWSKDPSTKVGAVIVDKNRRIVSTGYNGLPCNVEDYDFRLNNRELKYKIILHAEENAMSFAKQNLEGCSLYISSLPPCSHCASLIIQNGIKDVYIWDQEIPERWKENMSISMTILKEAGVDLHFIKKVENEIN